MRAWSHNHTFVFVYGTLKLGHGNNRLLKEAEFLCGAKTMDKMLLADGGFPVAYDENDPRFDGQEGKKGQVVGEIYAVSDTILNRLDQLEGHPEWYHRELREFKLDWGNSTIAWIYVGTNVHRSPDLLMTPNGDNLLEWG